MTNLSPPSPIPIKVVKYPIITDKSITDKSTKGLLNRKYSFLVDRYSDKPTIKSEIEYLFKVKVIKINTCLFPRKTKRVGKYVGWKSQYKKARITVAKDDTINLFGNS